jgi:hypothetical protein
MQNGVDGENDLRLELKSRQIVQRRMGQRIRKEVWDDMEVKGKAIRVRQIALNKECCESDLPTIRGHFRASAIASSSVTTPCFL